MADGVTLLNGLRSLTALVRNVCVVSLREIPRSGTKSASSKKPAWLVEVLIFARYARIEFFGVSKIKRADSSGGQEMAICN